MDREKGERTEPGPIGGPHATAEHEGVHEPSEHSIWPFVLSIGIVLVGIGLLGQPIVGAVGGIVVLIALVGWMWQPWIS